MKLYDMTFKVTETCQNGNERIITKHVYSPCFRTMPDGSQRHFIEMDRVNKAIKMLESRHYYNIEYIGTASTDLMFTTDEQPARPTYNY